MNEKNSTWLGYHTFDYDNLVDSSKYNSRTQIEQSHNAPPKMLLVVDCMEGTR